MLKVAKLVREHGGHCVFLNATEYICLNQSLISDNGFEQIKLPYIFPVSVADRLIMFAKAILSVFIDKIDLPFKKDKDFSLYKWLFELKKKFYFLRLQQPVVLEFAKRKENVQKLFDEHHFDSIVVAGDRHLFYENVILFEAKKRNVPCYIPPISISNNPQDSAKYKLTKAANYDVTDNIDFQEKWPEQCCKIQQGKIATFYEFWRIRPLFELDVLPPSPWIMGAGLSTRYMVGGEADANRYIANGVADKKLLVTGDSEFDELYQVFLNKEDLFRNIVEKYRLSKKRKIIIVALPQLYEHGLLPYDEHMDVIYTICKALQKTKSNVLVSLHPKMDINNYQFLKSEYDLSIIEERLSDILPIAAVFITGKGSSTWIWSVLCEIPVLVCDWYGHDAEISDSNYGVSAIKNKNHLETKLANLINDDKHYDEIVEQCRKSKHLVGRFDGRCGERIARQILNLNLSGSGL